MSIINYIKETKNEMMHVSWPSKSQSVNFSLVVIVVSVLVALFLALFDLIFSRTLSLVV